MPLGENKLIQKTSNKRKITRKENITRNTNIANKKSAAGQASKDPEAVTYATQKMTFYVKSDLMKRLRNFAYWERQSLTKAFNTVLEDGLKTKYKTKTMKKWILTPDKYLKPEEAALLRGYLEDKALAAIVKKKKKPVRDWAAIDIALSAGLRPSEICHLTIKDAFVGKGESSLFVKNGKGKKDRLVLIGDKLKTHLKGYLSWKKQAGETVTPDSYLFVSERGPKMTLSAIQKRFKHATNACGLDSRYSIRSARHTYGTMLYRATKDLRMVQKQLGHSNIQVTEVYADVLKEDTEKAVNALYA